MNKFSSRQHLLVALVAVTGIIFARANLVKLFFIPSSYGQTTTSTPPAAPTGLFVSGSSPTYIGIYWNDNSIDESEFIIERRFNGGAWSQVGSVVGNVTTKATTNVNTIYTDNNLSGAGIYDYRVKACNSAGCSSESSITSRTIDAEAPAVPSGLTATYSSTAGSVTVSWTDNSTGEWGFRLKRRVQGSGDWFGLASVFNNSTGGSVSFNDTYQLAINTTYDYVVRSYNTYESADSNIVTVTTGNTSGGDTTVPSVPANVTATLISSSSILISWTASTDNVAVSVYRIYRNGSEISWVSSPTLSYTNIGLSPGTSYSYTVAAQDSSNNLSAQSASVSATTLIPNLTTTSPTSACVGGEGRVPGLPTCLMPENLAGTAWNEVDNATGKVLNGAVCSVGVCGRNGEWRTWPSNKLLNGRYYSNGYPENSTYIQTPFNGAYWGKYYTNGVWEVSGGGIVQPGSSQIIYPPLSTTPTTTTTQTTTTNPSPAPSSIPASTPPPAITPTPTPVSTTSTPTPTTPTSTPAQPTSTPIAQCLQSGGLWCYSDYPASLLGYCAPAKSACERGDQAPLAALPQPPAIGLRASDQFLADRRAVLQDLRALERLVKRDIIEVDAKQLKVFKEKIISLKAGNEGDFSALQAYRDQIMSLQSDAPTNTERESTIDPRLEARALQQLKQGLRLFERHIKTIEAKVIKIEKSGITIDVAIKETIAKAKDMALQVKKAKAYSDIQDIAEQMPDVGQALNDALPRLEELLRLPRVLRLVDRRIADGEKAIKQASALAKRLKLDAANNLEAMRGIITNAKSTVAAVKTGGATEGLLDTLQEQVFDPLDEIFDLAEHIRAVASVRQAVNQAAANVKRYEARLRRLKAGSEDRQTASELLGKFKEQLVGLKALSTQKLTADIGDQIIDKLNAMEDLKVELEDAMDLASPDATQEQIKQLFSAPSEKIKPFKVEQLEQGVL